MRVRCEYCGAFDLDDLSDDEDQDLAFTFLAHAHVASRSHQEAVERAAWIEATFAHVPVIPDPASRE